MKNCRKNALKSMKGITLIALVITIIVLLILAGISISMLSGDNSILQRTTEAKIQTTHATVLEQMQLEANAYTIDKTTGKYSNSLINYLKGKSIISDISGEENKWLINVTTLLGSNQSMGNGAYPNDVYVLEKDLTTGNNSNLKIASTTPIRIAEVTNSNESYRVTYYETGTSDTLILGSLVDGKKTDTPNVPQPGESIDFEAKMAEAKANRVGYEAIGIGTDGNLVDMSLWYYTKIYGEEGEESVWLGGTKFNRKWCRLCQRICRRYCRWKNNRSSASIYHARGRR